MANFMCQLGKGYDAQLFGQTTVYDIVMKVFLDVINI